MKKRKTNIILILTDQCRREAIKYMPNVQKLASEGTNFTNAYTSTPLCQPARVSMITGLLPHQTGICGNGADPIDDKLRDQSFPNLLQKNGYYNAMIGKHHFIDSYGKYRDITEDNEIISKYGFNHVVQVLDDGENSMNQDAYTHFLQEKGLLEKFRSVKVNPNHGDDFFNHVFSQELTAEHFIYQSGHDFVSNYIQDNPFFLQWSFIGPHPPLWHGGELMHDPDDMLKPIGAEDSADCRLRRAHYMQKCTIIDSYIGKMVDLLIEKELFDDTVIIFTSDHGDNLGDYNIWDKRNFREGSVGVPLVMRGPGIPRDTMKNGNKTCKSLVSLLDLYPTIAQLGRVEGYNQKQRFGKSLLPVMNEVPDSSHKEIIAEFGTSIMIRTAGWKMVFDPQEEGVTSLYNLRSDKNELDNLAGNPSYESVEYSLIQKILSKRVQISQYTHERDQNRIQKLHIV